MDSLSKDRFFYAENFLLSNFLLNPQRHNSQLNCAIELRKPILRLSCYFVPAQDGSTQIPELLKWFHATKELDHMLHPYSTNEKKKQQKLAQKGLYLRFTKKWKYGSKVYFFLSGHEYFFFHINKVFFHWELQILLCRRVLGTSQTVAGKELQTRFTVSGSNWIF